MMRFTYPACQLLCLLLLSAAALAHAEQTPSSAASEESTKATTPRASLDERSSLNALALEAQLSRDEQQRLDAAGTEFLALWRVANSPEAKGIIILLPDDDESLDSPQGIGALRRRFPDSGWSSLTLSLPDPLGALLPARAQGVDGTAEKGETNRASGAAENAPDDEAKNPHEAPRTAHVQRIFARIDAGIAFAERQQAKFIVLLGHGSGAYWAAHYVAERTPDKVRHLMLVDSRQPESFSVAISSLIPQIKVSIADFYYPDSPAARQAALQRKQISQRQKAPDFVQVALESLPGNPEQTAEQLLRRLRGWLDKHTTTARAAVD
jgi:hypothetical protein